ncbi:MAG: C4-dicarboxylate TRAP transporter substrate-binding protein [Deltaproteobacteria bacterium]|jgi:tripartite ATP-independent transporter DctP family solute receptor|nr:C4-dicarboxylate TRAP transporter substrate-binding protein [Deltaproteobacteria bacterium]
MSKTFWLCLCCALALVFTCGAVAAQAKVTLRIAYENHPGEPIDTLAKKWAELALEKSKGELVLELYPSSQLGSKRDCLEMATMGANVVMLSDSGTLGDYTPDLGALAGPYLVDSWAEMDKILASDWMKEQGENLRKKGLYLITMNWTYGIRQLVARKPVVTPADLSGLKIRVPASRIQVAAMQALGGVPTPMPLAEAYTALSQGVIDGAENPVAVIYGQKLYEGAKYMSMIDYIYMPIGWAGGTAFFDTIPPELLTILNETAEEVAVISRDLVLKQDADMVETMKAEGVEVIQPDLVAFRKLAPAAYLDVPDLSPGIYDKLREIATK